MSFLLILDDIEINIIFKRIKHLYISVRAPDGSVHISAPAHMNIEKIGLFARSKLKWIKKKQGKVRLQRRESAKRFNEGEAHFLWGKSYMFCEINRPHSPKIEITGNRLQMYIKAGATIDKKRSLLEKWYRQQVLMMADSMIAGWEAKLGVEVSKVYIRRMKTLWGSCNYKKRSIRLNTALAKRSKKYLEYIVVHEMTHLLEPSHNKRFYSLMNHSLPNWKDLRQELNSRPLAVVS